MQRLEAFKIAVLQNMMLIQIAVPSWLFLEEQMTAVKTLPMALVFVGVLMVQLKRRY